MLFFTGAVILGPGAGSLPFNNSVQAIFDGAISFPGCVPFAVPDTASLGKGTLVVAVVPGTEWWTKGSLVLGFGGISFFTSFGALAVPRTGGWAIGTFVFPTVPGIEWWTMGRFVRGGIAFCSPFMPCGTVFFSFLGCLFFPFFLDLGSSGLGPSLSCQKNRQPFIRVYLV